VTDDEMRGHIVVRGVPFPRRWGLEEKGSPLPRKFKSITLGNGIFMSIFLPFYSGFHVDGLKLM